MGPRESDQIPTGSLGVRRRRCGRLAQNLHSERSARRSSFRPPRQRGRAPRLGARRFRLVQSGRRQRQFGLVWQRRSDWRAGQRRPAPRPQALQGRRRLCHLPRHNILLPRRRLRPAPPHPRPRLQRHLPRPVQRRRRRLRPQPRPPRRPQVHPQARRLMSWNHLVVFFCCLLLFVPRRDSTLPYFCCFGLRSFVFFYES
mmetsp:Transcript_8333/g.25739  ORF Transcript_8333/g.25739 Transcript_8333/m.25739 type:complete len:200 (+) Transcript_8333:552-1151(+)